MEKEVRRYFKKGLMRSFHGWTKDAAKETEMEELRAWIFDKEMLHDLYYFLCKCTFTTYDLNEILTELQDQPIPKNIRTMVNEYGRLLSKKMVHDMILFVDDL